MSTYVKESRKKRKLTNKHEYNQAGVVHCEMMGYLYTGGVHVDENSREWETGKPLGAIWGLLIFRVQEKGSSSPAKDTPWLVLKALT